MNNREQFEAFLVSEYAWANDALNVADFHGDDATGYYTGGDYIYDGQSCSEGLFWAWRGWQAASKASEQQLAAVVAENAALKNPDNWLSLSDYGYEASEVADGNGASENEALRAGMTAIINRITTPATDAFLAEVRAQGVEMFAAHCQKRHGEMMKSEPNEAVRNEAITATRRAGEFALYFAAQLRQGAES